MEAYSICYVLHNSVQLSVLCFTTPFTTTQFTKLKGYPFGLLTFSSWQLNMRKTLKVKKIILLAFKCTIECTNNSVENS